jgi:hypothetical protein
MAVASSRDHGNESSGSTRRLKFLQRLSNSLVFETDSAPLAQTVCVRVRRRAGAIWTLLRKKIVS